MTAIPKAISCLLAMLSLICTVLVVSCGGTSAPPTVCSTATSSASVQLAIDHPVFVKQSDDGYSLTFTLANCGTAKVNGIESRWGPTTSTISYNPHLLGFQGTTSLAANSEGTYNSTGKIFFVGDQPQHRFGFPDLDLSGAKPPSLIVTISVTVGGADAASWEGQVAVPA